MFLHFRMRSGAGSEGFGQLRKEEVAISMQNRGRKVRIGRTFKQSPVQLWVCSGCDRSRDVVIYVSVLNPVDNSKANTLDAPAPA